jgi:hypothetical protein
VPTGQPLDRSAEFPAAFDTLASRRNAQALFDAWVILGGDARGLKAADLVIKSVDDLVRNDDGQWHRRFNLKGQSLDPVTKARPTNSPFGPVADPVKDPPPPSDPSLLRTAEGVALAREVGREKFRARLAATIPIKRRLALMTAGVWETPMSADFPTMAGEVEEWVKRHAGAEATSTKDGAGLGVRVARVWEAYLRALAERRVGAAAN